MTTDNLIYFYLTGAIMGLAVAILILAMAIDRRTKSRKTSAKNRKE